jgi:hypothetical protein
MELKTPSKEEWRTAIENDQVKEIIYSFAESAYKTYKAEMHNFIDNNVPEDARDHFKTIIDNSYHVGFLHGFLGGGKTIDYDIAEALVYYFLYEKGMKQ